MTAKLVALAGPPCSGKSSIAEAIQKKFDLHWLQLDLILRQLMPNSQHGRADRDVAYKAMHLTAEELLRGGRSVLLDATYSAGEHRSTVEALVTALAVPLYLIECQVSPDVATRRFADRPPHLARDLTEERVRDVVSRYCYAGRGLTLSETNPFAANLAQAEDYLQNAAPLLVDGYWSAAARNYIRNS